MQILAFLAYYLLQLLLFEVKTFQLHCCVVQYQKDHTLEGDDEYLSFVVNFQFSLERKIKM